MIILESWTPRWRPQHDLENTSEVDKPKNTIIFIALNMCSFHWTQKKTIPTNICKNLHVAH